MSICTRQQEYFLNIFVIAMFAVIMAAQCSSNIDHCDDADPFPAGTVPGFHQMQYEVCGGLHYFYPYCSFANSCWTRQMHTGRGHQRPEGVEKAGDMHGYTSELTGRSRSSSRVGVPIVLERMAVSHQSC